MKKAKAAKPRIMSIRLKLLIPTDLIVIALCFILGFHSYFELKRTMMDMGMTQARTSAAISAEEIDPALLLGLSPGDEDSAAYRDARETLIRLKAACGMAYLYTLYVQDGRVYYQIDSDESENRCKIGDEFPSSYQLLESAFMGSPVFEEEITSDSFGDVITCYMPIFDADQNVIAVLGCDYDVAPILERLQHTAAQIIAISAACLFLSLFILALMIHGIMKNLRKVNRKLYDLVNSDGDLTNRLEIRSGDELEMIGGNVNNLLSHMQEIMSHISQSSRSLSKSSALMADHISHSGIGISNVSASMEEMSAAMEETSASLSQITAALETVSHSIDTVSDRAEEGKRFSDRMQENAKQIRASAVLEQRDAKNQAEQMSATVHEKIEKSRAVEEISMLTANIIAITEQTNLLSLNASIEAARAGEAGRGFAVVADEISKLASNSSEAAAQIELVSADVIEAVNGLATESERMIHFMDETAMRGYDSLLSTSESYREDAVSMNEMMCEFSQASSQLIENMHEMKDSIWTIHVAVEESTKGISNTTEATVSVAGDSKEVESMAQSNLEIAQALNQEVGKFKLE